MTYTRKQIKSGEGLFTSGEWTLVYQVGPDQYITCAKGEQPQNAHAVLVAGGKSHTAHRNVKQGGSLFKLNWC